MESSGNPVLSLIGLWMMLQLVAFLALLLGGIYALFCLGRAAAGLDRLASAVESLVASQNKPPGSTFTPGPVPPASYAPPSYQERGAVYAPPPVPAPPPTPPAASPPAGPNYNPGGSL